MKKIKTYFLTGILILIPVFIIYQAIALVAAIVTPFTTLPVLINFILGIVVVVLIGWSMVHIFKNRIQKYIIRVSKSKSGWFSIIATGILEFDNVSDKTKQAFHNPILYKVDDGIYKLGYITNEDMSFIENNTNTEATPTDAVWVYSPYPVNFFGDMLLVERRKIQKLDESKIQNLPLFILSAGILQK